MIQRIQSVHMVLAIISAALLFVFPVSWFYGSENTIEFFVFQLREHLPQAKPLVSGFFLIPLLVLTVALILLPLICIMQFKKLQFQYKIMRINMLLSVLLIGALLLFYISSLEKLTLTKADYDFGAFLPIFVLIFSFLAMRGIKSDIKLLRSVDRIR